MKSMRNSQTDDAAPAPGSGVIRAVRPRVVLVVDDHPLLLRALVDTLGSRGLEAEGELNPRRALERIAAAPARFGALVTDLNMPELTGLELAAFVRAVAPAIPIILHSGQPLLRTRKVLVDAVVAKDAGVDALVRELAVLLAR